MTEDLGYHIYSKVLNAKNFGVPQNRERIYIVGFKENIKFNFPKPHNMHVKIEDILENELNESFYLSHEYLEGLKKHRARHEAKGNGFGYVIIPRDGIANALVCGGMGKERNLVKDKILQNVWRKEGDEIQLRNNEGIRKMTPREWARLQGFPDSFEFPVSMTQAYKQLGNSVAVPVIKAIAEQMKKSLDNSIIFKEPKLKREEKDVITLLEKMYIKKAFTKSRIKFISSIESFIEDNYLRISNLNKLIKALETYQLSKRINNNQIKFSKKLINSQNKEEFLRLVKELFKNPKPINQLLLTDFE